MSINSVIVTGNLTRDPELRSAGNTSVLNLGIAVNDRVKEGDEWVDRPNYFDVSVWGAHGESLSRMLSKGQKVTIAGRLRWSSWEKDGEKRSKVDIVANSVEFMSKKSEADNGFADDSIPF